MKPFLYSVCAACIMLLASFAPPHNKGRRAGTLNTLEGNIESITTLTYLVAKDSSGIIIKGAVIGNILESWKYDKYGDVIEDDYREFNRPIYTSPQIRDRRGRIIKNNRMPAVLNHYDDYDTKHDYRYDTSGNLTYSSELFYQNGKISPAACKLTRYYYNASGKMLKSATFNNDTVEPWLSTIFHYNGEGQLIGNDETLTQNGIGALNTKTVCKLDKKGWEIERVTYRFPANILATDEKTTYNNSGDTLETVETDYTGKDSSIWQSIVRQFTHNYNCTTRTNSWRNGKLTYYNIFHFDAEKHVLDKSYYHIDYTNAGIADTVLLTGNLINDKHFNILQYDNNMDFGGPKYKVNYQYKYDSLGNWVEQLYILNGNPNQIIEREIQYFPNNNH